MTTTYHPKYSDFAREHYGQGERKGREQGLIEGRRDDLLTIAEERSLDLTAAQIERIAGCTDLAELKKWVKAAITAKEADDLFK